MANFKLLEQFECNFMVKMFVIYILQKSDKLYYE